MTTYYNVPYDNEAGGSFVEEGAALSWTASIGFIVNAIPDGTTGYLKIGLISGNPPANNDVLTQGAVTADAVGAAKLMLYPAYFRRDLQVPSSGIMSWTGTALSSTHSFKFDAQSSNVVTGEILTFSGGETCEVITIVSDAGTSGELAVRFISDVDQSLPADNATFTGDISGDGTVDGLIHDRAYTPLHLHRLLSDLNDDEDIYGDDDLSRLDPTPSGKDTDEIVRLLSTMVIDDTIAKHMYGGSVSQTSGDTLYSGLNLQVTSSNAATQPIIIQNDSIVTDYWKTGFMPHSIDGTVRLLLKTRDGGVDIDGRRVRGALLEFGDSYFFGGTTIGTATTALALFASPDGNNATAVGTVAGANYNTIVETENYQTIDFTNGNGATPYAYSVDFGSATSLETYERTKYIQRRGTAETLFGRNAQLFIGVNLNFAYDGESANLSAAEVLVWGTEIPYTLQGATSFTIGEVITFSGGSKGRLLYDNDSGASGTLIVSLEGTTPPATSETMSAPSGADGTVGTVTYNATAGKALLLGLDDQGTTGNVYLQNLTGLHPVDGQKVYGNTSNSSIDVNGAVSSRTINNQYIGVYTGTNYQTNFGLAVDPTDSVVGDKFPNLLGVSQEPPNNQTGLITGLKEGDTITCYPWDGVTTDVNGDAEPDFDEMAIATSAITTASTTIEVNSIPANTPAAGYLRVERDSDSNLDLIQYASWTSSTFTLVGTAPSAAAIANTVMRALVDEQIPAATTTASFSAIYLSTDTDVAIVVKNGSVTNGPIKPGPTTATFGASGFQVGVSRITDA